MNFQARGVSLPNTSLFIDGEWRPGAGVYPLYNPADGSQIAEIANCDASHAAAALDAAVRAQRSWGSLAPRARANLMYAAHRAMLERESDIVRAMTLESGKPLTESKAEFNLSADFLLWFAEQTAHIHGTFSSSSHGGFRVVTTHQPVGPCLLITPWNFPLLMIVRKAGAALAAGCTTVTKTAQETPLTAALFIETLVEAGFPKGVANLLHTTSPPAVSETLLKDRRLRKVSFTGSTRTGSLLLKLGADNIVNTSLELGGDGPFIVLADADVDLAAEHALICKFRNAGQACVAANRIIVDRKVEREFTDKFVRKVGNLKVGDGMDPVDVGPMISARQRDRLYDTINQLKAAGGEVLTGGRAVATSRLFFRAYGHPLRRTERGHVQQRVIRASCGDLRRRWSSTGARIRQQLELRPCFLRLHPRPDAGDGGGRATRIRHGRHQPRHHGGSCRALWRNQMVRHRTRGRSRRRL